VTHDDELVRTTVDLLQRRTRPGSLRSDQTSSSPTNGTDGSGTTGRVRLRGDVDDLTLRQLQFGALECRVLGTF
jgi:hypothetical protein